VLSTQFTPCSNRYSEKCGHLPFETVPSSICKIAVNKNTVNQRLSHRLPLASLLKSVLVQIASFPCSYAVYSQGIMVNGSGCEDTESSKYKILRNAYDLLIRRDMTYVPYRNWDYKCGCHYIEYLSSYCKADKSKCPTAHMYVFFRKHQQQNYTS
jgi:hypothetical protein